MTWRPIALTILLAVVACGPDPAGPVLSSHSPYHRYCADSGNPDAATCPSPIYCPPTYQGQDPDLTGEALQAAGRCPTPQPKPSYRPSPTPQPSLSPPGPSPSPGAHCRSGDPLQGIYHPYRLQVLNPCQRFTGKVLAVIHESDGDYHIWTAPDAAYASLLNSANQYHGTPALVVEISPNCPNQPASGADAAQCPPSPVAPPGVGDHVEVWGAYNLDKDHGWNEIHPINQLTRL